MKLGLAIAVAGLSVVTISTVRSCGSASAPDQRLAARLGDLCEIATDGADKPVKGVKKLGRYMLAHSGELLGDLGDTLAVIERIPDDDAHDERAHLAHERIAPVLHQCARQWMAFAEAVERDPEANEIAERAMIRLNRTLEIILGGSATMRDLPRRLEQLF